MSELWKVLQQLVGDKRTQEEQKNFAYKRSVYGLPQGATNVDMAPLQYLGMRMKPTFVPDKEWPYLAEANYSGLGGIRIRDSYDTSLTLPGILAHENFHARDPGSTRYTDPTTQDYVDRERSQADTEKLNALAEALASHKSKLEREYKPRELGITGQTGSNEMMAQTVGWEALQPAGMTFLRSQLAKDIGMTPEQRLLYHRRRYPTPQGLDAVVGIPEK